MDVQPITMSPELAQAKLDATLRQLKRRRAKDETLEALRAGYAALAEGTPLISLQEAIIAGGVDENGRPRLAVARSDRTSVIVRHRWNRRIVFDSASNTAGRRGPTLERAILRPEIWGWFDSARSAVPLVPPDALERAGNPDLRKCFTLFEADWESIPVDPYLLRQIGAGDLYAVLSEWELTELEVSVMRGLVAG